VTLFTRGKVRVSEFDVVPGWMGPVGKVFSSQSASGRRKLIEEKRQGGTVNPAVFAELSAQLAKGELKHELISSPRCLLSRGTVSIHDCSGNFTFDHVLLGTGFEKGLHPLQLQVSRDLKAPRSDCGVPLLDSGLQWLPGLFVAGCHAELALGPTAGNLLGARLAAKRILKVA
jgi:hypothetical protein